MKLGIDATPLAQAKSGIGYHVESLVRALAATRRLDDILLFSNRPPLWDEAPPTGVRFVDRRLFPKRAAWMQFVLPRLIAEEKPDLTHYINFNAPILGRHPFVVTFHDMVLFRHPEFFTWKKRVLTRNLMPLVGRRALGILTVTEAARREIVEYLEIDPARVHVVPAAPADLYRPVNDLGAITAVRDRHRLPNPYILFVGTLEPRKNLPRLLAAFDRLKRETGLPHDLAIVGARGWKFDPIFATVEALAARESVRFLDYVPLEAMPALYAGADLLVFPSLYEGFGVPPLEAMRVGTPAVVSATPAIREVCGGAAIEIDPFSVESIAGGMRRVLESPVEHAALRQRGLLRSAEFTWAHSAARAIPVYEQALGRLGAVRGPLPEAGAEVAGPPVPVRPELSSAILETLRYGDLFQSPMTRDELARGLFRIAATPEEIERALRVDPALRAQIGNSDGYLFLVDRSTLVERRKDMQARHEALIAANKADLRHLARLPFVRMLAFSGGTAHRNSPDHSDVDLFVVAAEGKLATVAATIFLVSHLLRKRHIFCANYLVDEAHLAVAARDLYTAHQLVNLRPLEATPIYDRLLDQNLWAREHFPNARPWRPENLWPSDRAGRALQRLWERLLTPLATLSEPICRAVLLRRFRSRRARTAGGDVILEPGRLKLHFKDLKGTTLQRFGPR
ncbi:MAG: glycosyltransferase family 4 protein [Candidatus Eisenbacteria bacterium]|nr:glycosyltransferase family 4 protein [Candidatus Eisenbacteria bacterium]MCC7142164.1 glycosyltransferase family 4 protein [Candidatus Eisenbacteria bacterium]